LNFHNLSFNYKDIGTAFPALAARMRRVEGMGRGEEVTGGE
jgi:hypothetical protein